MHHILRKNPTPAVLESQPGARDPLVMHKDGTSVAFPKVCKIMKEKLQTISQAKLVITVIITYSSGSPGAMRWP